MSRGKDAPFYKIDLFRGENELLQNLKIGSVKYVEMHCWLRIIICPEEVPYIMIMMSE